MLEQAEDLQLEHDRRLIERRQSERRTHERMGSTACPRCSSRYLSRSSTRWWERPLRWVTPLVPFRCRTCEWRGWRRAGWLQDRQITDAHPIGRNQYTHDRQDVSNRGSASRA